jgi:hypothetical protein
MTWVRLSNDDLIRVPDGADPDYFRRIQENALQVKANPKPKRKAPRSTCGSRRRRGRTAVQVHAEYMAMAVLVDRANESETK